MDVRLGKKQWVGSAVCVAGALTIVTAYYLWPACRQQWSIWRLCKDVARERFATDRVAHGVFRPDPQLRERIETVRRLNAIPALTSALLEMLERASDSDVISDALRCIGSADVMPALVARVDGGADDEVRRKLIRVIGEFGVEAEDSLDYLTTIMRSGEEPEPVRIEAAMARKRIQMAIEVRRKMERAGRRSQPPASVQNTESP